MRLYRGGEMDMGKREEKKKQERKQEERRYTTETKTGKKGER